MKLTSDEEKAFDEKYQMLIDAYAQAGDFFRNHKAEFKKIVEMAKDHFAKIEQDRQRAGFN